MQTASERVSSCFFFNDTATTEIYTLSLHDALPISPAPGRETAPPPRRGNRDFFPARAGPRGRRRTPRRECRSAAARARDRKSTRLKSSHAHTPDAVFCLEKKNKAATDATLPAPVAL